MAKRSSDPRVAYPEVKVQVRDLVRVVGIVSPVAPRGSVFGKIRFIEQQGINGHRRLMPGAPQRYATGEPGKAQGRDRMGIVEGSREYRAYGVSIRGKFVLSRNPGSRLEDRHEVGTGPSACCGYCCLIYPTEFNIWGKFFLSSPRG